MGGGAGSRRPEALRGAVEDEALAEDEAALRKITETVMQVPAKLVSAVREFIAKQEVKDDDA